METEDTLEIKFIGDFAALYKDLDDTWVQSVPKEREYISSRSRLVDLLTTLIKPELKLLDAGCGLGHVLPGMNAKCLELPLAKIDLLHTAVQKVQTRYSKFKFSHVVSGSLTINTKKDLL